MSASDVWVCDLEANGWARECDTVWCIATRNLGTRKEKFFGPDDIVAGLEFLSTCPIVVFHNGLGYDEVVLDRLYGWLHPNMEDSLIMSRLYRPDRPGGHSIEAWGKALGLHKPGHDDWTQFSDEMQHRCVEDVRIGTRVVGQLLQEAQGCDWTEALRVEYAAQRLQNRIEERGFTLDVPAARTFVAETQAVRDRIEADLSEYLPDRPVAKGTPISKPWKVNGTPTKAATDWLGDDVELLAGPFTRVEYEPFNFNSPKQVQSFLLGIGWVPDDFNYVKAARGGFETNPDGSYKISSPKISESSLELLTHPAGKLFNERRVLPHRIGLVSRVNQSTGEPGGWLNEVRPDGRVEGQAIPLGTPTARYRHRQIMNVPRVGTSYGQELRSLLTAGDGLVLVGTDASGLEARVGGHYAAEYDGGQYARAVLEGDIHSSNAEAFSRAADMQVSRTLAKTLGYALMYGATGRKVASQAGVPVKVGDAMVAAFWDNMPGLKAVKERVAMEARKYGYVTGMDGRRIFVRSPHSALNALFQSGGAILMKHAFVGACQPDDPWYCLLTQHDEAQCEMEQQYVPDHVQRWVTLGTQLTDRFGLRIPLVFESKQGRTWSDTH